MSDFTINLDNLSPKPTELKECLEKKLGAGGFGMVYSAEYDSTPVAVKKLIIPELELTKADKIEFEKEAKVMQSLDHNNIVRLFGYTVEPVCILVMERAEASLYDVLKDRVRYPYLPWKLRLALARDIATGIQYLHSLTPPIIHRDLKAGNALLAKTWRIFLTDFGLAKIKLNLSIGTKGKGTPRWMAPEALEEESVETPAMDIYSFGMILYEILTRQIPFYNLTNIFSISNLVIKGKRPEVSQEEEKKEFCPDGYRKLMEECWGQDPKDRPQINEIINRLGIMIKAATDQQLCSSVMENSICGRKTKDHQEKFFHQCVGGTFQLPKDDQKQNLTEPLPQEVLIDSQVATILQKKDKKVQDTQDRKTPTEVREVEPLPQDVLKKDKKMQDTQDTQTHTQASLTLFQLSYLNYSTYETTDDRKKNLQKALALSLQAASQGNDEAEQWIALIYLFENQDTEHNTEIFRLSEMGVKKNIPLAYFILGFCYMKGIGVEKDEKKSIPLFQQGVELEEPYSQTALGTLCLVGTEELKQDVKEGIRLFQLASKQGIGSASMGLAGCYGEGKGVEQDVGEAIRWIHLAIAQGEITALYALGCCYEEGKCGIEKNETEAFRLYQLAAVQGHKEAQSKLKEQT